MKTFFLTITFALTTIFSIAQTSEHLSFKGVQIDGKLDEYVSKMKQNGFTHLGTEKGIAILNGDFAGYKNCNVGVSTLSSNDLVYKISVLLPEQDKWSGLSSNYFELKKMLIEKYGNPKDVVEKFDGNSEPKDDKSKMYQVMFDRCKYYSIWKTEKGEIQLSIDRSDASSCNVKLLYVDKINGDKIKAKAKDDL
jgi:hypothetical protein